MYHSSKTRVKKSIKLLDKEFSVKYYSYKIVFFDDLLKCFEWAFDEEHKNGRK